MEDNNDSYLAEIGLLLRKADETRNKGQYTKGIELAQQALAQARQQSLPLFQGHALMLIAAQLPRQGKYEEAIQTYQSAIVIWQHQHNDTNLARSLNEQALIYIDVGLFDEALENLTQSMDIARKTNQVSLLFWAYNRTGIVLTHLLKYEEAKNFLLQAMVLSKKLDIEAQFCILNNLADYSVNYVRELKSQLEGKLTDQAMVVVEEGVLYSQRALKMARQSNNPYREALVLSNYGALLAYGGDFNGAEHNIKLSLALSQANGYKGLVLDAEVLIARFMLLKGEADNAVETFERLLPKLNEQEEHLLSLSIHQEVSQAYQKMGQPDKALEHYKLYHELERQQRSSVAATRVKLMTSMSELSDAKRELERVRMHAELERFRMEESENERNALKSLVQELNQKIHIDELTGIKNRRYMMDKLGTIMQTDREFCIALIDVDFFKRINDTYGHQRGDVLLHNLAQLIDKTLPEYSFVSRHGGEEFMVLFESRDISSTHIHCEKIRQAVIDDPSCNLDTTTPLTISIGIGQRRHDDVLDQLVERVDQALYRAKDNGRNCVVDEAYP